MTSSRNAMSSKSRHVRRYLDTMVYTKLREPSGWRWFSVWTFLEAWRNDRYPSHRLIRCLSRDVRCIWAAIQRQDTTMNDPKPGFPSTTYRFFVPLFLHMIRIALVYTLTGGPFYVDFFFASFFCQNLYQIFLETATTPLPPQKKEMEPHVIVSFSLWGSSIQNPNRKSQNWVGKTPASTAS